MKKHYDLVVLGGGAAGMTAALVGAIEGLRVLLIEKSAQLGGTSARSAGTLWIPGNFSMAANEAQNDIDAARAYLNALVQNRSPAIMREAFLTQGPVMLTYLQERTAIRFKPCPRHADYHPDLPGAQTGGRPVEPEIFDGRNLAGSFDLLRPPITEFMVFGGMMVSKADIDLLLKAGRSLAGTVHALQLGSRYLRDRLRFSRGTRLTMGNALCAALLHECQKHRVEIRTMTNVTEIDRETDRTETANSPEKPKITSYQLTLQTPLAPRTTAESTQQITSHNIVFSGGGFSGNPQLRAEHLPAPTPEYTAAFEGADGSSQHLANNLGAIFGPSCEHNAWWFPSSLLSRANGSTGVFPHIIMDRAKPGLIAVNAAGQRFVNEGISYHQFAKAQYASGAIPCWLVADARFVRRYGLGIIRPGGSGLASAVARGYVQKATSLEALARDIGVDPSGLIDSARRMTAFASSGIDEDFGKGSDPLSRQNGDPGAGLPNPGLGRLETPPFYAVKVVPTDLGTSRGLLTDCSGNLLDNNFQPLTGLYACGNDMQSVMGGQYPAPGVTLGPGMTFAYVAALDIARRLKPR
ncbi:MAG: FAD-dependent oxidoreductase [Burkholderiaceae bacterium]